MHLFTQLPQILPSILPSNITLHITLHITQFFTLHFTPCLESLFAKPCFTSIVVKGCMYLRHRYLTSFHLAHPSLCEHQLSRSLESRSALFCWCHSAWIMAPNTSTGKVDLLSFRPTPDELERAREMLASSDVKVKAFKVRAILQFAKGNPGDTANRILASRGDERLDQLARCIAFQQEETEQAQHQSQQRRRTWRSHRRRAHVRNPVAQRIWQRGKPTHG